ncbi:Alpha/Beta hydrolase protein [Podospora didyma]|uniref:1-alkyl-2-acetylglycerophosphocholine esterase n=1 Tax=Podospora didyma TaxID=330526 RepID=A0AAE0NRY8_9PEZI|nr:Alpha/Beta hydrolase protein [Podospora didyma]
MLVVAGGGIFKLPAAAAGVFPEPPTPFQVKWESLELTDVNRMDPYNATHPRRLMISKFSPVPRPACLGTCRVPYMSQRVASAEEDLLDLFVDYISQGKTKWPRGALAESWMQVCCKEVTKDRNNNSVYDDDDGHGHGHVPQKKLPTVLFGSGFNISRLFYSGTAQHLAGMGYEVITMDHPYESNVVEFPSDGTVILGGRPDPANTSALEFALNVRAADARFVLDTLGFYPQRNNTVVHIGHSFGGAAAAVAMAADSRIAGGVNLDGSMFGSVLSTGVAPRPFLLLGSEGHNSSTPTETSWRQFINSTRRRPHGEKAWLKEVNLAGSLHWSLHDFSIFADVTPGLRANEDLVTFFFGRILGSRVMEILREYLSDFVEFALGRSGNEGLLVGPSQRFPEISFL